MLLVNAADTKRMSEPGVRIIEVFVLLRGFRIIEVFVLLRGFRIIEVFVLQRFSYYRGVRIIGVRIIEVSVL